MTFYSNNPRTTTTDPKKRNRSTQMRQWRRFKDKFNKNLLSVAGVYTLIVVITMALLADFLANNKPLAVKYQGEWYFPIMQEYGMEITGVGKQGNMTPVRWKKLKCDFVLWPPVPYASNGMDMKNIHASPLEKQQVSSWRWRHWLGTDNLGRDVLAGLIHASRISLAVGIIAMGVAGFIGILLGSLAGYFGDYYFKNSWGQLLLNLLGGAASIFYALGVRGYELSDALDTSFFSFMGELSWSLLIMGGIMVGINKIAAFIKYPGFFAQKVHIPVDVIVSRLIEIVVSIPILFLIVFVIAIAEPSLLLVILVIGITQWTNIARFMRAELLRIRQLSFIEALRALGVSDFRILWRHAIPNALTPVLIILAFGIASAVLVESTLSFLGLGVPANTITWGSMLSLARQYPSNWWLAVFPGSAIFVTVTAFNLIASGLSEALDPKLIS